MFKLVFVFALLCSSCLSSPVIFPEAEEAFKKVTQSKVAYECMSDMHKFLTTEHLSHPYFKYLRKMPRLFVNCFPKPENSSAEPRLAAELDDEFKVSISWVNDMQTGWVGYVLSIRHVAVSLKKRKFSEISKDTESGEDEEETFEKFLVLSARLSLQGDLTIKLFDHECCLYVADLLLGFNPFQSG